VSDRTRIDAVLREVKEWPLEERRELAIALIGDTTPLHDNPSIDDLVGVARGDGPPPSDKK